MICRRCGNRIPEYLISREYFQCPECGRQFGSPRAMSEHRGSEPRYARAESGYDRPRSRFEPEYDDSPADDRYYDDGQGYYDDGYYDDPPYEHDQYYDDHAYDDQYYDDQYRDDQTYDDGYYDDGQGYYDDSQDYSDDFVDFDEPAPRGAKKQPRVPKPKKPKGPKPTMKLVTLIWALIIEVVALIVVACVAAGMNAGQPGEIVPAPESAVVETVPEVTADPNATPNPYPVV